MKKDLYSNFVTMHLAKDATKTNIEHISNVHEEALKLCKTSSDILSSSEYNYIKSTINKRAIPNICLLIKDHKEKDGDGNYPTRLVVPAKHFTADFPHVGQRGIKAILDKNKIKYSRKTIVQASYLKAKLETLGIKSDKHTIMSIDAKNMCPSVKFGQIKKAVKFSLTSASSGDKEIVHRCLNLVKFRMANTIVSFKDLNWIYGGDEAVEIKGLIIGGYESAFFADLVVS